MQQDSAVLDLHPLEAALVGLLLLGGISFGMIKLGLVPHIPITVAIIGLLTYGYFKKVPIKVMETGMADGAKSGFGAVLIFFFIGMLISSWMASGTIPTFIYLALGLVSGKFFYAIVFLITSVVGVSIGSSLTTAATLGVAFVSISGALDLSVAVTAGAAISGAFFGDKMSPLSDTTNLASTTVNVDLFEHIKNMAWTTVPAFLISFVLYAVLSPTEEAASFDKIAMLKETLEAMKIVHWYSLIPFIVLAGFAIKKASAIVTLSVGTFTALIISLFTKNGQKGNELITVLYSGYQSNSGVKEVDDLLSRGGMESMMFSISLVFLALSMGGLLFKLGVLPGLLKGIHHFLNRVPVLISSAATTAVGLNFLLGEQYLSILLTGNTFKDRFEQLGLHPKNLSRVLEDAGTVVNPLVPWGVCGVFLTGVLGVSTIDYMPFVFFCLASPILTVLLGATGISITHSDQ